MHKLAPAAIEHMTMATATSVFTSYHAPTELHSIQIGRARLKQRREECQPACRMPFASLVHAGQSARAKTALLRVWIVMNGNAELVYPGMAILGHPYCIGLVHIATHGATRSRHTIRYPAHRAPQARMSASKLRVSTCFHKSHAAFCACSL